MSRWIISPGCSRSYRRGGPAGSRALSLLSPRRLSTRLTVAGETPTVVAISLPGMRWRRRLSMRSITSGGVGLRSRCGRELRRSEEHTSELQSRPHLVCRLLLEKKKKKKKNKLKEKKKKKKKNKKINKKQT